MQTTKVLLTFAVMLLSTFGLSQLPSDVGNAPGIQFSDSNYGEVSTSDLNVHLDIPIVDKDGIGTPFHAPLRFNNNSWLIIRDGVHVPFWLNYPIDTVCTQFDGCTIERITMASNFEDPVNSANFPFGRLAVAYFSDPGAFDLATFYGYTDPAGTFHQFPNGQVVVLCNQPGCTQYTTHWSTTMTDGSGIFVNLDTAGDHGGTYVIMPDGMKIFPYPD